MAFVWYHLLQTQSKSFVILPTDDLVWIKLIISFLWMNWFNLSWPANLTQSWTNIDWHNQTVDQTQTFLTVFSKEAITQIFPLQPEQHSLISCAHVHLHGTVSTPATWFRLLL